MSLHIETDPDPLYIVYCAGRASQAVVKPTQAAAQDVADRLAIAYPGHEFMVLECIYTASADRPPRANGPGAAPGTLHL